MNTRTTTLFFLHLIFLWCFSSLLWAIELKEHSASYTANIKKGVSIKGTAVRSLKKLDNEHWLYRFDVDSFVADIKESARLHTTQSAEPDKANQLIIKPLHYDYTLSAFLMPDRKRQVQFDWQTKTAISPLKKDKWSLNAIPENTYDALTYQLQLLVDVSTGKKEMTYQLAHKGKLRESTFVVLGAEVIDTRFGKLNSILAKKQRDDDAKRQTFLWFSADYPLLLLKMTQRESDGEEYEIQLKEATIEGKAVDFSGYVVK
jgi:hypothetical protein